MRSEISDILRESIAYGLDHRAPAVTHSMAHARGLDVPLADRFIGMYVNDLTLDYGERGRAAVRQFLSEAAEQRADSATHCAGVCELAGGLVCGCLATFSAALSSFAPTSFLWGFSWSAFCQ